MPMSANIHSGRVFEISATRSPSETPSEAKPAAISLEIRSHSAQVVHCHWPFTLRRNTGDSDEAATRSLNKVTAFRPPVAVCGVLIASAIVDSIHPLRAAHLCRMQPARQAFRVSEV